MKKLSSPRQDQPLLEHQLLLQHLPAHLLQLLHLLELQLPHLPLAANPLLLQAEKRATIIRCHKIL